VGHCDASSLTKADAARWKTEMQTQGRSLKTVRNDLSEMSGIWSWGVRHGAVAENVFQGLLPPKKAAEDQGKKVRAYSDAEVALILSAARKETGALRCLPWVLALTGCRLGEVAQSNKEDVVAVEGIDCLRVHDDGGDRQTGEGKRRVKNAGSRRLVPVHPALRTEGFLEYVAALPKRSPMFPDVPPDAVFGSRSASAQKLLSRFVRRLGIKASNISPAHSFRHWFVTTARRGLMNRDVRDALTGHSSKLNESDDYGTSAREMPALLASAIATITLPGLEAPPFQLTPEEKVQA
jgi:integrase